MPNAIAPERSAAEHPQVGIALKVELWLIAGVVGAVGFWLVQVVTGGPTIPDFMGEQIVSARGSRASLAPLVGWLVHVGVSLSYAFLLAVIVLLLEGMAFGARAVVTLVVALGLGYVTALIAPPAISVTISLLSGRGWPGELSPLNTEVALPLWNHLGFFTINWAIQVVGPVLCRSWQ